MNYLVLNTWRLRNGAPDWDKAEQHIQSLDTDTLTRVYDELLCIDEDFTPADAVEMAWLGLDELKRAYAGHNHAMVLTWPDGTRILAVGCEEIGAGIDPFEGYHALLFVTNLGVPEAMGWAPGVEAPGHADAKILDREAA